MIQFASPEEALLYGLVGYGYVPPDDDDSDRHGRWRKCWHCDVATTEMECWSCGRNDGLRPFSHGFVGAHQMSFNG